MATYHNGTSNGGQNGGDDNEDWEAYPLTVAEDCGDFYLCENLPNDSPFKIILKQHSDAQVKNAPRWPVKDGKGYPKRHLNREKNKLSVRGKLLEYPILPGQEKPYLNRKPGPVRALYREGKNENGYDVVYHDKTKGKLDFAVAARVS